jgi:lipopolysaccharide export system permease protein
MHVIQRYMLRQLIANSLAFTVIASVVALFINPEGLIGLALSGAMPVDKFLLANIYLLPMILCHTGPLGVALGIGSAYWRWASDQHIVTLRSIGISNIGIAAPGVLCAAVAAGWTGLASLYLMPNACQRLYDIVYVSVANAPYRLLKEGYLNGVAPGLAISFENWQSSDTIAHPKIIDTRGDSFSVISAQAGRFMPSSDGDTLLLEHGFVKKKSTLNSEGQPVDFNEMSLPLDRRQVEASSRGLATFERGIGDLLDPPGKVRRRPGEAARWIAEGHRRLVMPLLCLSYGLLVVGVLSWRQSARLGILLRVLGLAVAVVFAHILGVILYAVIGARWDLLALYYAVALAPGGVGLALMLAADRPGIGRSSASRGGLLPMRQVL